MRLGDGDDVRSHSESLERKDVPVRTQAALDLVENQGSAMAIGQCAAFLQKFDRALVDPAFAENRLKHNGTSVVVDRCPQCFDVVLRQRTSRLRAEAQNPCDTLSCPVRDMAPKVRP